MNDYNTAKELVRDFIVDHCKGDIDLICDVDISKVPKTGKYGKPPTYDPKWLMDPDDTIISRAVQYLLYCDLIEDLKLEDMGSRYRGDTIFTPGNIMGKKQLLLKGDSRTFWSFQELGEYDNSMELRKMIKRFLGDYHKFPNFMLLPNQRVYVERYSYPHGMIVQNESLNNFRGLSKPGFFDYIDRFLLEVKAYIEAGASSDTVFDELMVANKEGFEKYKNNFNLFLQDQNLDIMFEEGALKEAFTFKELCRWKKVANYHENVEHFIEAFYLLFDYRKHMITEKLKSIMEV